MSDMSEQVIEEKEKRVEFTQDFCQVEFCVGYSYTDSEKWRHLIWLSFMFWSISFAWCWHKYGEVNIIHKSPDGEIKEIMPQTVKKCKYCNNVKW